MKGKYPSDLRRAKDRKALHAHSHRDRYFDSIKPPPNVIAERDARNREHRTLTARLMGDPLPGQSALDRM